MDVSAETSAIPVPRKQYRAAVIFVVIVALAIAIGTCVAGLNEIFDVDYDEGVYWQTLRAMSAGYHLYGQIFCSQPPLFLVSIYPFYALFGSTIVSARVGVAALSLLGLAGAYLMGNALSGRVGGITALVILIVTPIWIAQSHVLQADGPATAFLFLTTGAAFMWREHPTGRRGMAFSILCAVTLSLGVLIKLLDVAATVPILLLILARLWHVRQETASSIRANLMPMAAAMVASIIATLIVLAPFLDSLDALFQQVVTFHLAAKKVMIYSEGRNFQTLGHFFAANGVLSMAAIIGLIFSILRRDWRIVPLTAWFATTLFLLALHVPLFAHHEIVLIPSLIAMIALGLDRLPTIMVHKRITWEHKGVLLQGLLALAAVLVSIPDDYNYYRRLSAQGRSAATQQMTETAADLQRVTTPGQWVITDGQFVAGLANRDTPPWLVDTSFVRVLSGYLTPRELLQTGADERVHAVLFAKGRLRAAPVAGFHSWVADHFHLLRMDNTGTELWVR